jgi:hypothetical protein
MPPSHSYFHRTTGVGPYPHVPNSTQPASPGMHQCLYDPLLLPPPFQPGPSYVGGYPGPVAGQYPSAGLGMNGGNIPPGYTQPYGAPPPPPFHHHQLAPYAGVSNTQPQSWGHGHYSTASGPACMQPNNVKVDVGEVGEQVVRGADGSENKGAVSSVGRPRRICPNKEVSNRGAL